LIPVFRSNLENAACESTPHKRRRFNTPIGGSDSHAGPLNWIGIPEVGPEGRPFIKEYAV